jgi:hypothetical protein
MNSAYFDNSQNLTNLKTLRSPPSNRKEPINIPLGSS